jgi:hypothetical protein
MISPGISAIKPRRGTESGTLPVTDARCGPFDDPELTVVADSWPALPQAAKAGIVAMVRALELGVR